MAFVSHCLLVGRPKKKVTRSVVDNCLQNSGGISDVFVPSLAGIGLVGFLSPTLSKALRD